jgi:ubiquinone/menaquinone biosynthesis C-methylase UbiE
MLAKQVKRLMPSPRVDYDCIASGYDLRFARGDTPGVAAALQSLASNLGAERILEVGCGTGRWLEDLRAFSLDLYGLDLSVGMLQQARQRRGLVHLVRGRAGQLPFSGNRYDLVYCVNALHHFDEPRAFVHEAWRLLHPGGALAIVGMDPRLAQDHWYVYDYFPGTYETDLARFPSWDTVRDWMVAAGFGQVAWQPVEEIHDTRVGRAVLDDPFLEKDATSQLSLLSEEAYRAGLGRIESTLATTEAAGEAVTFAADLTLAIISGRRVQAHPQ